MKQYIFDCNSCRTRCDGKSKGIYIFNNDVKFSEERENKVIQQINTVDGFLAKKCEKDGYPDIEVLHKPTGKVFYIEIKVQRRTFMAVKRLLPEADLEPSETLALNLSDLLRYFEIHEKDGAPVFILWCVLERPCVVPAGETRYFYQNVELLKSIYQKYYDKRRFRRKSGYGDVVDGQHKGVVVNYHFSLNEFRELHLLELLNSMK